MPMNPDRKAQIEGQSGAQSWAQSKAQNGALVRALIFNKASAEILAEYSDYNNVFSIENIVELPKHTEIKDHTIELKEDKQPLFGPIYNLEYVELEILKIYIETKLAINFIRPSKSPAGAPILFDKKSNRSPRFCMDYWDLNNITIKNIGESLDWLGWARRFI